jgi:hypothetical protein
MEVWRNGNLTFKDCYDKIVRVQLWSMGLTKHLLINNVLQCDKVVLIVTLIDKLFSKLFREGSMPATFSYASILHAVGQVLDQVGVKSIAIHEEEDGLFVEGLNSDGQLQVQIHYTIADLYDLVSRAENQEEERTVTPTAGLLRQFLAAHNRELVGASL